MFPIFDIFLPKVKMFCANAAKKTATTKARNR